MICITADTQYEGSRNVSEILTLFYDETDAEYFQGKSNVNKGQLCLPYAQRFVYVSVDEISAALYEDAAFVIKASDAVYFANDAFVIRFHGDYASVLAR